jgi:2-polyprenyl-6-methoxyphenol hydroxylase-like FAD-dependent oxidoreductase
MDVINSSTYLYRLAQQHAETYVAEKMALVGDAAHVVHPAGGQGMSLAIQDAAALADAAGPVLTQGAADDELQRGLVSYEGERRPLNAKAMTTAHRAARFARPGRLNYLLAKTTLRALARLPGGFRVISRRFFGAAETAR